MEDLAVRIICLLTTLLLGSIVTSATAHERGHTSAAPTHADGIEGRQIAAPPWSAACMTDHGPSECGEPMWIYGSGYAHPRYRRAF